MKSFCTPVIKLTLGTLLLFLVGQNVFAQSGKVFRDFNNNGIVDTNEGGIAGISVRSYRNDGALLGVATSDNQGLYSLIPSAAVGEDVRIEFVIPESLNIFFSSAFAAGPATNGTSVQFVKGPASDVNFGVNRAIDFCEAGPPVSVVCFVIGAGTTVGNNLLATVPYSATGSSESVVGHPNAPGASVGAIWGTSYQNETDRLFLASFMRRHTAFGTAGTGSIYVTTNARDPSKSASYEFIKLDGLTVPHVGGGTVKIRTGQDPHYTLNYFADIIHDGLNPSDSVGKISLGDMDMSSDGQHLYVVNVFDKRLYRIAIDADKNLLTNPVAADVLAFDIPNPGCVGGIARPFGLGVRGDDIFVGVTCDASISLQQSDLRAYVYKLNTITNTFSEVINFPLNYTRGNVAGITFEREKSRWQPWTTDADWNDDNSTVGQVFSFSYRPEALCPQPLLSDIVFDDDGALVLGFMDRFGHQAIYHGPDPHGNTANGEYRKIDPRAGGDIIRICNTGTFAKPIYSIESLGKCGGNGGGQFVGATYSDPEYEYYTGDNFNNDSHTETAIGSLGLVPGSGELIAAAFDPIQEQAGGKVFMTGFKVLSNTTGEQIRGFSLLNDIPENNGNNLFGKASGLGGVEVLCLPKPIEIGNRVWLDTNRNGIQDPGELPISGVILELYNNTNRLVGHDTTDASGSYYFNQRNVIDTIGVDKPNRPGVQIDTDYTVRVALNQYNGQGTGPLLGLQLTSQPANPNDPAEPIAIRDNNAIIVNNTIVATVHTGYTGENDHTIDIGFAPVPMLNLTKLVNKSKANVGDVISYTLVLTNTGTGAATAITVRDSVSTNAALLPGTVTASAGTFVAGSSRHTWSIPNLPANSTVTLIYSVSVLKEGVVYNTATIPGDTAQVCTSIPFLVCKGSNYAILIAGPLGYGSYSFYNGSSLLYRGPLNSFTATAPGVYRVEVNNGQSGCLQTACCPMLIEEAAGIPSTLTVLVTNPTCLATQPQANGKIQVAGLGADPTQYSYAMAEGSRFALTNVTPLPIPTDGVIAANLTDSKTYTVRVYNKLGCFEDRTVSLNMTCECPTNSCIPVSIKRIVN